MVPPVPIPNTVVKHSYAESTCLETDWEDRALLVKLSTRQGAFLFIEILAGLFLSGWNYIGKPRIAQKFTGRDFTWV